MGGAILASSPYVDISKITLIKKTLHKFNFTKKFGQLLNWPQTIFTMPVIPVTKKFKSTIFLAKNPRF